MKAYIINILIVLVLLIPGRIFSQNDDIRISKTDGQVIPDFSWLNQKDGPRPKYVWENREDYIYHEMYYPDSAKMTAPEVFPIMRCPWVFNRSMKWTRNTEGTIIAYSGGADLQLTGDKQVSAWYSDPSNKISDSGEATTFEKLNTKRRRDCAVLPSFQFHLSQHPVLEITILESTDDWQFVASMKGRSGAPFICSGWQTGSKTMWFDIEQALKGKGYDLNYAELHFAIGTWAKSSESGSKIRFKARIISRPAVVACLPVIRTMESAKYGIPVSAIITGISDKGVKVYANVDGKKLEMTKSGDVWKTTINGLSLGSYNVEIACEQTNIAPSTVLVRVTDGLFWKHNKEYNTIGKNSETRVPLSGSFQGTPFFRDAGLSSEKMVNTQQEWDNWDRAEAPGEHQHYWESLTRNELNERFSYLAKNAWDIVHLHSHYGIWERFDASGNLAPHGVEQFSRYVDEAARHGLNVMVTLSSYPYSNNTRFAFEGTTPYKQTIEKGFKDEDWYSPQNEPFRTMYHQYLKDFVNTFKDETSVFSFSSSGEGDWKNGYKRFQDTKEVIRGIDSNHIIVSEPILDLEKIPTLNSEGFTSDIVGCRNYGHGASFHSDEEMSLFLRLMKILPNPYIAEGCYPSSNLYTKFTFPDNRPQFNCWVGKDEYRYSVRDWVYFGLVSRMPLIVTWDETFTEDERIVFNEVRKLINWNQPFEKPTIAILIDDYKKSDRKVYGKFERLFSHLAIDYRFVEKKSDSKPGDWLIDPSQPFDTIKYSKLSNFPVKIKNQIPFSLSGNYSTHFSISSDHRSLIGYIFNKTNYATTGYYLGGNFNRMPLPSLFELSMKNIPENLNYRLYDLDSKKVIFQGKTGKNLKLKIEDTKADFVLVVYP